MGVLGNTAAVMVLQSISVSSQHVAPQTYTALYANYILMKLEKNKKQKQNKEVVKRYEQTPHQGSYPDDKQAYEEMLKSVSHRKNAN